MQLYKSVRPINLTGLKLVVPGFKGIELIVLGH